MGRIHAGALLEELPNEGKTTQGNNLRRKEHQKGTNHNLRNEVSCFTVKKAKMPAMAQALATYLFFS